MAGEVASKTELLKIAEGIKIEWQIHIKRLRAPRFAVPLFESEHQNLSAVLPSECVACAVVIVNGIAKRIISKRHVAVGR